MKTVWYELSFLRRTSAEVLAGRSVLPVAGHPRGGVLALILLVSVLCRACQQVVSSDPTRSLASHHGALSRKRYGQV
jgi:hypothetical protein